MVPTPPIELSAETLATKVGEGEAALRAYIRGAEADTVETRLERARAVTGRLAVLAPEVRAVVLRVNRAILQDLLDEVRTSLRTTADDRPLFRNPFAIRLPATTPDTTTYGRLQQLRGRVEQSNLELQRIERTGGSTAGNALLQTRDFGNELMREGSQMISGVQGGIRPTLRNLSQGNIVPQAVVLGGVTLAVFTAWEKLKQLVVGDDGHPGFGRRMGRAMKRAGIAVLAFFGLRYLMGGSGNGFGTGTGSGPSSGDAGGGSGPGERPLRSDDPVPDGGVPKMAPAPAPKMDVPAVPPDKIEPKEEVEAHIIDLPRETVEDRGVEGVVRPATKNITISVIIDAKPKEWVLEPGKALVESETGGLFAARREGDRISIVVRKAGDIGFSFNNDKTRPTHTLKVTPKPKPVAGPFAAPDRDWAKEAKDIFARPPSVHVVVLGPGTEPKGRYDKEKDVVYGYAVDGKAMTASELKTFLAAKKKDGKLEWVVFETKPGSSANPGFVDPPSICEYLQWELQVPSMTAYSGGERHQRVKLEQIVRDGDKDTPSTAESQVEWEKKYHLVQICFRGWDPDEVKKPTANNRVFDGSGLSADFKLRTAAEMMAKVKATKVPEGKKLAVLFGTGKALDFNHGEEAAFNAFKEMCLKEFGVFFTRYTTEEVEDLGVYGHESWKEKKTYVPDNGPAKLLAGFNHCSVRLLGERDKRRLAGGDPGNAAAFLVDGEEKPLTATQVLERARALPEAAQPKAIRVSPEYSNRNVEFDPAYKALRELSLNSFGYFLAPKGGHQYDLALEQRELKDRRALWKPLASDTTDDPGEKLPKGFGDVKPDKVTLTFAESDKRSNLRRDYFAKTEPSAQIRIVPSVHVKKSKIVPIETTVNGKSFTIYDDAIDPPTFVLPGSTTPVDIVAARAFLKKHAADPKATWVRFYGTEDDDGRWEIEDGVRILMEGLPVSYQSTIEVKGDKYGRYSSYKSVHLPTRETGRLEEFE
nr:hypothetical protein [Candidatus Peribacteraceae bacterium]